MTFEDSLSDHVKEEILKALLDRGDVFSDIDRFLYGAVDPTLLPKGVIGTQVHVTKGWHQPRALHYTVDLRCLFGE